LWIASGFQSTLPAWGETVNNKVLGEIVDISIHSPRMGRDGTNLKNVGMQNNFNPLSPHGERHGQGPDRLHSGRNFNPLSPHGERHE